TPREGGSARQPPLRHPPSLPRTTPPPNRCPSVAPNPRCADPAPSRQQDRRADGAAARERAGRGGGGAPRHFLADGGLDVAGRKPRKQVVRTPPQFVLCLDVVEQ